MGETKQQRDELLDQLDFVTEAQRIRNDLGIFHVSPSSSVFDGKTMIYMKPEEFFRRFRSGFWANHSCGKTRYVYELNKYLIVTEKDETKGGNDG